MTDYDLRCSTCNKPQADVVVMINAWRTVLCDTCIDQCAERLLRYRQQRQQKDRVRLRWCYNAAFTELSTFGRWAFMRAYAAAPSVPDDACTWIFTGSVPMDSTQTERPT